MTTSVEYLKGKDFADQAINALADLKRALPKDWKKALIPYQEKIKKQAELAGSTKTAAVLMLLDKANKSGLTDNLLKIQHFFLLAAYSDML